MHTTRLAQAEDRELGETLVGATKYFWGDESAVCFEGREIMCLKIEYDGERE